MDLNGGQTEELLLNRVLCRNNWAKGLKRALVSVGVIVFKS